MARECAPAAWRARVTAAVGAELAAGPVTVLAHPALWIALTVGPLSVLLSQHALRRVRTVATGVSVIVVIDPLVGLLAGTLWFGERVVLTPLSAATAIASGVAVVAGIVLCHTGPPPGGRRRTASAPGSLRAPGGLGSGAAARGTLAASTTR